MTAMQELMNFIGAYSHVDPKTLIRIIKDEYIPKEKQQIMDAHLVAGIYSTQQDAEDYYNQTYKP